MCELVEVLQQCLALLQRIPAVIWSGLIASVITLSGVFASNWSHARRLREQLRHDAAEKAKERTATLRRDATLPFVEEMTKAKAHLASLPEMDPASVNLAQGLQGFFITAEKLQLVVDTPAALLIGELVAARTEQLLRLTAKARPLFEAKHALSIAQGLRAESQAEVKRILAAIGTFNETAQRDAAIFDALQRQFDVFQEQAKAHSRRAQEAWKTINSLHASYVRETFEEAREANKIEISVVLELRRNLDLTVNPDAIREQRELHAERAAAAVSDLVRALEKD